MVSILGGLQEMEAMMASGKSEGSSIELERSGQEQTSLCKNNLENHELPETESEWQARCIELELALQKFRDQAHNIRKLLRDKVSPFLLQFIYGPSGRWAKFLRPSQNI